jgi:2'-5' RNA ligase
VQRASGGRVTRAETIHLTLAFLGDVEEECLSVLRKFRIRGERHPLPIEASRYWLHNRIVWVGPYETPQPLQFLAASLRQALNQSNFKTDSRPFASHVTLIRKARDPGVLPPLPGVEWPVEEFVLVRSRLSAAGSSYEVLERFPLS